MRISVFGVGYVGSVCAVALAADGHHVIGVDVNADKVADVNAGRSPIVEPGLAPLLADAVAAGRLRATVSAADAVDASDLSLVCVGTPSRRNGSLDLAALTRACDEIGLALREKAARHLVVLRSTMLPGTTRQTMMPTLERASGKRAGDDFGLVVNPEFLREGTALDDFRTPPLTLLGVDQESDAACVRVLYRRIDAPFVCTSIEVAEMLKYASNAWHALKVCFANEIGTMCQRLGLESHDVMEIFCRDDKLNVSAAYLRPGFAFGGSCLPKDVRALQYRAKELDLDLPVLQAILPSNRLHIQRALDEVLQTGRTAIGFLGFSYKPATDDLRESPLVVLAEALLGSGRRLRIYDRSVSHARLIGSNKRYIDQQIPHLASLLSDNLDELLDTSDVIVVGNAAPEFREAVLRCRPDHIVIDLARLSVCRSRIAADYRTIC